MSMMVSFVLSFFPRDVLDEILNLIERFLRIFLPTLLFSLSDYMLDITGCYTFQPSLKMKNIFLKKKEGKRCTTRNQCSI